MSVIDELEKLKKLKEQGILTETEFESEKNKILKKDVKVEKLSNNTEEKINNVEKNILNKDIKKQDNNKNIQQNKKKFCSKCGNEIHEGEKFCGKCGNKIHKNKIKMYQLIIAVVIVITIPIGIIIFDKNKEQTNSNSNSNISEEITTNNKNTSTKTQTSTNLEVLDIKNNELKINATELISEIISANNATTEYKYTKKLQDSRGNYNVYSIGNSTLHGTLAAYPFLILENKSTGNVVRICIYYAYNGGTRLNTNSINTNYSILYDALNAINQQELASAVMTIKNNFDGTTATKSVKGLKYGIMDNPNSSGFYLMLGTTMDSLE